MRDEHRSFDNFLSMCGGHRNTEVYSQNRVVRRRSSALATGSRLSAHFLHASKNLFFSLCLVINKVASKENKRRKFGPSSRELKLRNGLCLEMHPNFKENNWRIASSLLCRNWPICMHDEEEKRFHSAYTCIQWTLSRYEIHTVARSFLCIKRQLTQPLLQKRTSGSQDEERREWKRTTNFFFCFVHEMRKLKRAAAGEKNDAKIASSYQREEEEKKASFWLLALARLAIDGQWSSLPIRVHCRKRKLNMLIMRIWAIALLIITTLTSEEKIRKLTEFFFACAICSLL